MSALFSKIIGVSFLSVSLLALAPLAQPAFAQDSAPAAVPGEGPQPLLPAATEETALPALPETPASEQAAPEPIAEQQGEFLPSPPPEGDLASPAAPQPGVPGAVPVTTGEAGAVPMPAPAPGGQFDENLFFDAEALVPEGELARKGAPSKVDPSLNPGSRLVVATKDYNPNSREARLVSAERAMKLGRFESALEIYEGLYTKNKRDPNILLGRAVALQSLGRDDEAIRAYEELLNIRPDNLDAQINMSGLIGRLYPAVALQKLHDVYRKNPGNTAVVAQIAVVEAKLGRYEEAIKFLGTAASMEPQNASHVFNMAVIADRAGDKKSAVRYYEDALELDTLYGAGRSIPRESIFARLAELR